MVGWHHRLYGHEFEQALGVGEGQGSLACCSPWGSKESDMTEKLLLFTLPGESQQSMEHFVRERGWEKCDQWKPLIFDGMAKRLGKQGVSSSVL